MDEVLPDDLNELYAGCEATAWVCVCPGCWECGAAEDRDCVCLVRPSWKTAAVLADSMMLDAGDR